MKDSQPMLTISLSSWIWGKPGCGKSTLMKAMLYNDRMKRRLRQLLKEWSTSNVIIASFFFFRPGMNLQKSKRGLLQSLLHQIFSQRGWMMDDVFSLTEMKQAAIDAKKAPDRSATWSLNELRRILRKWRDYDDAYLYLHVDGIDEIDCEPIELANLLNEITEYPKVKVLAAGRYHADFDACFDSSKKLKIHELTEPDILRYVVDNLNHPTMLDLLTESTDRVEFVKLTTEIISAAQGVFQWVKIVVESLMRGIRHFEDFDALMSRLREYPQDLDDLYRFLYNNIDPRYKQSAALWLLLIKEQLRQFGQRQLSSYCIAQLDAHDIRDPGFLVKRLQKGRSGEYPLNLSNSAWGFPCYTNRILHGMRFDTDAVSQVCRSKAGSCISGYRHSAPISSISLLLRRT